MAAAGAALGHAEAIIASGGEPAGPDGELAALKDRHVRLRAPIPRPGKFFHTGLNSNKHVANTGHAVPENVPDDRSVLARFMRSSAFCNAWTGNPALRRM